MALPTMSDKEQAPPSTAGLRIRVQFAGQMLPAYIVGETLSIHGHGQPVDTLAKIDIMSYGHDGLIQGNKLKMWLLNKGYKSIRVLY